MLRSAFGTAPALYLDAELVGTFVNMTPYYTLHVNVQYVYVFFEIQAYVLRPL